MKDKIVKFISERRIRLQVKSLARKIEEDFRPDHIVMVYVSNGAMIFAADLARAITLPMRIDNIAASSYSGKSSTGELKMRSAMKMDVRNEKVLLVDDILDTGRTLSEIKKILLRQGASEVRICVLLDKPSRRQIEISADYKGFTIPDLFVVGYGLDYNELYRNLPFIGVIK